MRMTFKPIDMSERELNAFRSATGMQTLQAATFELLARAFRLHNSYIESPFWGNPETQKRYKAFLATVKETRLISDFLKIKNVMNEEQKRYRWDIKLTNQLSDPRFWDQATENAETLDDVDKVETPWKKAARYAYYRSEDLRFLNEEVFSEMEGYIELARAEIAGLNGRTREQERSTIDKFDAYLTDLDLRLKDKQAGMAQAMLVRLQLVADHKSLAFDDVVYHFSEQLKAVKIAYEEKIGPRPYVAPNQGLTGKDFHHYHRFIKTYGNRAARDALQRLPWVRDGHYVYDTTKNTWGTNKNIVEEAEIPSSRVTFLRWFFRGRNARHEALHDVTRYLEVQMHLESAEAMQAQLAEGNTDGLSDNELNDLLQSQRALQREQQRIQLLKNGLNAVFHKQSKRVLTSYLHKITNAIEGLAEVQKTILQKAQASLPNIINNEAALDKVMRLLDQLTNTISLLPEGHPLIEETRGVQISLHNQIAQQKLDAFSLALEALPFQQRAVYDETGLLYKVADREAVDAYFERITKYLAPQQVEALQLIAGILTGEHYREGRQISYDDIYSAMAHCFYEPLPIVQTIIRKVIAPSVYGARDHNPAYRLLLACEEHLEHDRRGDLLRNVAQHENATLFIALDEALKTGAEFEAQENVSVDGQAMPMEAFLARLTNLDVRALKKSAADYLTAYQGEHETHWRIFEVMPTGEAVQYALHRLSCLLAQRDYAAISWSACLSELQHVLKADTDHVDEILTRFVSTVEFSFNDIPGIDAVIERFANASAKTLWQNRRERVLLDRFNARLHQRGSEDIAPLRDFLERNKPFPATDWAKENLAVQLHYMPRDTWTPEHHALVNVIDDEALRQQYQTNLLKCVLLDRAFAKAHAEHLPAEEDVSGSFELITAPDFKAVCQEALTRFDQQERIDNVAGFRILHGLLMHDLAFVSDLGELQADMRRLLEKFKAQVNVQMAAQEIISLIDTQHFDEAKEKLHRQKGFLTFYQTIDDQNSYDEVVDAITLIIEAMEVRLSQDILNAGGPPVLLRDTALSLLEEMPSEIQDVEHLQWILRNYNNLCNMATLLRTEMHAIRDGHATTLPSLPLFNEAIKRQVLGSYLSRGDRDDLVISLRLITEDEDFATLPTQPRTTLLALLRLLKNKAQESDAAIFSEHDEQVAASGVGDSTSGIDDATSESSGGSDAGGEPGLSGSSERGRLADAAQLNMVENKINDLEKVRDEIENFTYEREKLEKERERLLLKLSCPENRTTLGGELFTPTELQAEVSQEIFQSFMNTENCVVATRKLREIFSPTNTDETLKAGVAKDLLKFLAAACLVTQNGVLSAKRKAAYILLVKVSTAVNQLAEQPNFPFVLLSRHWESINDFLDRAFISIGEIELDQKQVFPELGELLLIIFEAGLAGNDTRENWSTHLEQEVLPRLGSQTPACNPRLSAGLHAFYRVLKNNYSDEDRRIILAYDRHYRDMDSGSVHRTGDVRIYAKTTPVQTPQASSVSTDGINHAYG